jgi:hypothetical protein
MVCSLVITSRFILFVAFVNDRCLQIVELNLFYVVVFHLIVRLIPPVTLYFLLILAIDSNEYQFPGRTIRHLNNRIRLKYGYFRPGNGERIRTVFVPCREIVVYSSRFRAVFTSYNTI